MSLIAVAGFQHETNTFAPMPTEMENFEMGGSWPPLLRGNEVQEKLKGLNIPTAGFIDNCQHETYPILWTSAEPGGYVCDKAFDRICSEIIDGIATSKADAVYLDLHGAMVTRKHDDGEAEVLRRIRERFGADFPIAVSLDLHGNLSRQFFDLATVVTIYRTYPHVDIAATGARAAELLNYAMREKIYGSFCQIDFLIPITAQSTFYSPARAIYSRLESVNAISADICMGFPPADVPCCGPTVFAYGRKQSQADAAVDKIKQTILDAKPQFNMRMISAVDAVQTALLSSENTVVIADPQDNPGAGATGDTTGLLQELIRAKVPDAVISMIYDPDAARAAHQAGIGNKISVEIGGRYKQFSQPVSVTAQVAALADGPFRFTGPMYRGATANLGAMAKLKISGTEIAVVVGSRRTQNADQEMFRVVGIEPSEHRIVCVKSSIHFLADYSQISSQILFAESPGANICRPSKLGYSRLRSGMRFLD